MLLSLVKVWFLVTSVSAIRVLEICPKNSNSTGKCDAKKWKVQLPSGCFRSFPRRNYIGEARMLCDLYGGSFTLETIPYIAPQIDCMSKIGKSYFVDAILEKGNWTTLDGSRTLNFTNFMEFNPMDCDQGSILVWYPRKNKINPLGKLKCKKDTTKTSSMCFEIEMNEIIEPTECIKTDFSYQGGKPLAFSIEASASDCQAKCAANSVCDGFVYVYASGTGAQQFACVLSNELGQEIPSPGTMIGPANCPK